ncbi:MAG: YebC/PmpR family DNA-binding transcriptional regulator [Patescibacteria group bacterium]
MSGHSHWAGIKHKKGTTDQKRGQLFSKLLKAVTIAAKQEPSPQFNPRLRTTIEKARENNVPQDNIERAIKRASEIGKNLEELIIEAYGPEGVAILIEAATDNRNRTVAEIKKILNEQNAKWADPGSVQWAFENKNGDWQAKFKQSASNETKEKLKNIIAELENHDDIQKVHTNI